MPRAPATKPVRPSTTVVVIRAGRPARAVMIGPGARAGLWAVPVITLLLSVWAGWHLRGEVESSHAITAEAHGDGSESDDGHDSDARAPVDSAPRQSAATEAPGPPPIPTGDPGPVGARVRGGVPPSCSRGRRIDRSGFDHRVALTFDGAPDPRTTRAILTILREHGVPATFFVTGDKLETSAGQALMRAITAGGRHQVASRGWTGEPAEDAQAFAVGVRRTHAALRALGVRPRFYRFPAAEGDCERAGLLWARGYGVVGWHVNSADWCFAEGRGTCAENRYDNMPEALRSDFAQHLFRRVHARGGGIVLMHEGLQFTVDQLGGAIQMLKDRGYQFTTLADSQAFPALNEEAQPGGRNRATSRPAAASQETTERRTPRPTKARPAQPAEPSEPAERAPEPTTPTPTPPTPAPSPESAPAANDETG